MNSSAVTAGSIQAKIRARRTAIQAYYQWLINSQSMSSIIKEFEQDRNELKKADGEYFRDLLQGMSKHSEKLEKTLTPYLDRDFKDINPVEKAVLCLGTYEMMFKQDVPLRVVMNEAIELAKMFGAEESHKYINGVLDKAARDIRTAEYSK
jgi:N utilization substance protein B